MRNISLFILIFSFFYPFETNCQGLFFTNIKDTIFIDYAAGKYYLQQINKESKITKLPIFYEDIKSPVPLKYYEKNIYLPIFYKIKKGDTKYRILRMYFSKDSAEIKKVNLIESNLIKEGAKILIGYYPIPFKRIENNNLPDSSKLTFEKSNKSLIFISGPANTFVPPINDIPYPFVLSNKIPEHSVVEITNPMSKKSILAKVIGKIPPGKYPLDILLLLSKKDATNLGFIDAKFFVAVKYYH